MKHLALLLFAPLLIGDVVAAQLNKTGQQFDDDVRDQIVLPDTSSLQILELIHNGNQWRVWDHITIASNGVFRVFTNKIEILSGTLPDAVHNTLRESIQPASHWHDMQGVPTASIGVDDSHRIWPNSIEALYDYFKTQPSDHHILRSVGAWREIWDDIDRYYNEPIDK